MTEEEAEALDELLTNTIPEVNPNVEGPFIRKSGLIPRGLPRSKEATHESIGMKPDDLINFLAERTSVKSGNALRYPEACLGEVH